MRDGEQCHYDVDGSPVNDGGDEPTGRVVLSHDGTEQRRSQRTLQERTREPERQTGRLDRFASTVSHASAPPGGRRRGTRPRRRSRGWLRRADDRPGTPPHIHDGIFEHGFSDTDHATGFEDRKSVV